MVTKEDHVIMERAVAKLEKRNASLAGLCPEMEMHRFLLGTGSLPFWTSDNWPIWIHVAEHQPYL